MNPIQNPRDALAKIGHQLPEPAAAVASYVPAARHGGVIYVSGQLPLVKGELTASGPVPTETDLETAQKAAATCILNALAAADGLLQGDWSSVKSALRVAVFVNSDPSFNQHHLIANGASDLLVEAFGDAGKHARAAVGVPGLPLGAAVEVELWLAEASRT
ncbi:RidA family protein [Mucisphaera sp.]|uniref:RidA family protein n=1 Tax=Mucisphaera sp. TaxID=2913024 RepID=UPI003D0AF8B2